MWVRAIRIGLIVMKWMRLNVTRVLGQKDVGQAEKEDYTEEALNRNGKYENCFTSFNCRDLLTLLVE
jgi:hypothetical protein